MKINKELWCWLNNLYWESLFVRLLWTTVTNYYQAPLFSTVELQRSTLKTTTPAVNNCEAWFALLNCAEQPSSLHRSPPVSLMSDSRRNQSRELEMASHLGMMRRMGIWSWQNENENVSIFCDLRLAQADQIFMVITPNESLASEFKFRWDQKEKRFVEVIGGLMIRYEGLINGVVGSYQLIWSPAVTQHMKHLASNI